MTCRTAIRHVGFDNVDFNFEKKTDDFLEQSNHLTARVTEALNTSQSQCRGGDKFPLGNFFPPTAVKAEEKLSKSDTNFMVLIYKMEFKRLFDVCLVLIYISKW